MVTISGTLTNTGDQPLTNEDRTIWVVFNGEIYNFRQLRAELTTQGCVFESDCDTEVVLQAYEAWGLDAFARFRGMWGLALVDARNDRAARGELERMLIIQVNGHLRSIGNALAG